MEKGRHKMGCNALQPCEDLWDEAAGGEGFLPKDLSTHNETRMSPRGKIKKNPEKSKRITWRDKRQRGQSSLPFGWR